MAALYYLSLHLSHQPRFSHIQQGSRSANLDATSKAIMESPPVEEESSGRLIIDSNNREALIVIVTATGFSWTLLTLIIRVVSRLHVRNSLGLEEYLVIAASVAAGISSACILTAINHGLGRRIENIDPEDNEMILKLLWISELYYPVALSIAKAAALPLLTQLTRIRKFIVACYALAILNVLWGCLSVVALGARCHLEMPWYDHSAKICPSLYGRWVAVEIGSLLIEILIFAVFMSIIRILKMRHSIKLKVMFAFATRLPVIIPTIARLIFLRQGLSVDKDTTFALTKAIIATQAVLHYTTMASSFAYLKPFLRVFDSNLGATNRVDTVVSSGYTPSKWNDHTGGRSEERESNSTPNYHMHRLNRSGKTQIEVIDGQAPLSTPVHEQLILSPTTGSKPQEKAAPLDYREYQQMQRNRYTSRETMVQPMITKTQEWHIVTETRVPGQSDIQ